MVFQVSNRLMEHLDLGLDAWGLGLLGLEFLLTWDLSLSNGCVNFFNERGKGLHFDKGFYEVAILNLCLNFW